MAKLRSVGVPEGRSCPAWLKVKRALYCVKRPMTAVAAFCTDELKPDPMGEKALMAVESGVPDWA